jgi:hypothetical protein
MLRTTIKCMLIVPVQLYVKLNVLLPVHHIISVANVMHFSFNLLRIKGLYMFRALLAHPQEALHTRHLVYCVRIVKLQSWHSQLTLYARNIPSAVCTALPEDEQVMLETCRGP